MPLKDATPGTFLLEIHQFGVDKPDTLDLDAYAEAASLEHLTLSAGDRSALLRGTRLDEVAKATLDSVTWLPAGLARVQDFDQLTLNTEGPVFTEPGKYTKYKDVIELIDDDHRTLTSFILMDDGTWFEMMRADYWRKK